MSTSRAFSNHPIITILVGSLALVSGCQEFACDEPRNGERCVVADRGLEWEVHDISAVIVNRDDRSAMVAVSSATRSDGGGLVEYGGCDYVVAIAQFTMGWNTPDADIDDALSSHRHSLYSPFDLVVDDAGLPSGTFGSVRKVTCRREQHGDPEYRGTECSSFTSIDGAGTIIEATDSEATVELDFVAGRSRLILPVCSYSPSEEGWTE